MPCRLKLEDIQSLKQLSDNSPLLSNIKIELLIPFISSELTNNLDQLVQILSTIASLKEVRLSFSQAELKKTQLKMYSFLTDNLPGVTFVNS
ncbi:MAG: hypothetical protein H0X51_08850 [Parachlamydiaceae bacterium]|nr:hypothetical protein [Parachlamydiaceae bacterium]